MEKPKKHILAFFLLALITILLIHSEKCISLALEGFSVWAFCVLPSLFPFLFFTGILTRTSVIENLCKRLSFLTQKVFSLDGACAYAAILSYISGYPVGAKTTESLVEKGLIDKRNALSCALLSSTSGVVFVIGTTGGAFLRNTSFGAVIYFCHIFSAMATAALFSGKTGKKNLAAVLSEKQSGGILFEAMKDAVLSVIMVGGYIALFYVIYGVLSDLKVLLPLEKLLDFLFGSFGESVGKDILAGVFECTQGIKKIAVSCENKKAAAIISCGLISFGGLSVNLQVLSFLQNCGVKASGYFLGKLVQAAIAVLLSTLALSFC